MCNVVNLEFEVELGGGEALPRERQHFSMKRRVLCKNTDAHQQQIFNGSNSFDSVIDWVVYPSLPPSRSF